MTESDIGATNCLIPLADLLKDSLGFFFSVPNKFYSVEKVKSGKKNNQKLRVSLPEIILVEVQTAITLNATVTVVSDSDSDDSDSDVEMDTSMASHPQHDDESDADGESEEDIILTKKRRHHQIPSGSDDD